MKVATQYPVVFTDGAGPYGANELHAPYFPASEEHLIEHGLGTVPVVAWVTPLDNIPDIRAIHNIAVVGEDATTIRLRVSAQPGQVGRVRFTVYAMTE